MVKVPCHRNGPLRYSRCGGMSRTGGGNRLFRSRNVSAADISKRDKPDRSNCKGGRRNFTNDCVSKKDLLYPALSRNRRLGRKRPGADRQWPPRSADEITR